MKSECSCGQIQCCLDGVTKLVNRCLPTSKYCWIIGSDGIHGRGTHESLVKDAPSIATRIPMAWCSPKIRIRVGDQYRLKSRKFRTVCRIFHGTDHIANQPMCLPHKPITNRRRT